MITKATLRTCRGELESALEKEDRKSFALARQEDINDE